MPIRAIDPSRRTVGHPVAAGPVAAAAANPVPAPAPAPRSRPTLVTPASKPEAITSANVAPPITPDAAGPQPAGDRPRPQKRAHHKVDRTGPNWDENGDYIVGRGRPPKPPHWKTGQSGNPNGPKPCERLDRQTEFDKEVLADFTAKVNGADVTLDMGTFALQLLKANAAKDGVRAQQKLLDVFMLTLRKMVSNDDTPEMEAWEKELIDEIIASYDLPAKPVIRRTNRSASGEGDAA